MADTFWAAIDAQLKALTTAGSADDVLRILQADRGVELTPYGSQDTPDHANFYGSGGDGTVFEALREAGWMRIWSEASYYWAMKAPDGSIITYVEGDVYRGDNKA